MPHDVDACPVRDCPLCDAVTEQGAAVVAHTASACDVPFCRLCRPDLPRKPGRPRTLDAKRATATITLDADEVRLLDEGPKGRIGMVRHYMRVGMGLAPVRPGPRATPPRGSRT